MEKQMYDRIVNITVDVQNDFCPEGALAVAYGDQVIKPLNALNRFNRSHNGTILFTGDQHPVSTPHFDKWPVHCIAGTEGAAFHRDLEVLKHDEIINKGMGQTDGYSGFEGLTDTGFTIEQFVTPKKRERVAVIIGGLATDYCVFNTVMDALDIDPLEGHIGVFAAEDAMRGVNLQPQDSEKALRAMQEAGAVLTTSTKILTQRAFALAV